LAQSDKFGNSERGNAWAKRIARDFTERVRAEAKNIPFVKPVVLIPGLFSWADTVRLGKSVGALPNGRHAGEPISHGANPSVGFRRDGAVTAMAEAVASVQPGYGNTAPLQLEVDFGNLDDAQAETCLATLIRAHFALGGTLMNINVVDDRRFGASRIPEEPDLIVRVSPPTRLHGLFRQSLVRLSKKLVVERVVLRFS
jgi:formate C-acetyltransferase